MPVNLFKNSTFSSMDVRLFTCDEKNGLGTVSFKDILVVQKSQITTWTYKTLYMIGIFTISTG